MGTASPFPRQTEATPDLVKTFSLAMYSFACSQSSTQSMFVEQILDRASDTQIETVLVLSVGRDA